ncbi:MAG: lipopolysaccharide heptosyltransferase II [Ignavibacteriaceae bacterium]
MNPEAKLVKRILLIKPRGIGDVLLSTIILENLKNYYTFAEIDYLVEPFVKPVLENISLINSVHTIGKKEFPLKAAARLRKYRYDMIIDLWSNPRSAQITFLTGAKFRVGFGYRGRKYAYNIRGTSAKGAHHSAEHNLELLHTLGIPVISKKIHFNLTPDEIKKAKHYFAENIKTTKPVIGIIPAGGWPSKRCDAVKWVEICRAIENKFDLKFLILWGPGDEKDSEYICNELGEVSHIAPPTELREMAALINQCDLVIANDSGPMHIAAALNIPTIGIFGPTNPKAHGPYSQNSSYVIKEDLFCIICNKLTCPYNHECMLELPVEKILSAIEKTGSDKIFKAGR